MRFLTRTVVVFSVFVVFLWPWHPASATTPHALLARFPLLKQQHLLTCEAAAASMATLGRVSERQIMATMPRNIDPNFGFRGNPDGRQRKNFVDYGVYAGPVHHVLLQYGYNSDVLMYGTDDQLKSYINRGWPVVAWITYDLWHSKPHLFQAGGIPFFLVLWEHAVLLVGYDAKDVYANDPWTGKRRRYDWSSFNRGWGYFGNMALAVQPCPPPPPATGLTISGISARAITWAWDRQAVGTRYNVTVTRRGASTQVVYRGVQSDAGFTLPAPIANTPYEITIAAVAPCGANSAPVSLWTELLAQPPSPSPTATLTPLPTRGANPSPPPLTPTPTVPSSPMPSTLTPGPTTNS